MDPIKYQQRLSPSIPKGKNTPKFSSYSRKALEVCGPCFPDNQHSSCAVGVYLSCGHQDRMHASRIHGLPRPAYCDNTAGDHNAFTYHIRIHVATNKLTSS